MTKVLILKILVVVTLFIIIGSLFSALFYLVKDQGHKDSTRVVKALSIRIGLSLTLFILLGIGYATGFIPSTGLR
jgi:predicted Kef-type K+ transport protein